MKTFLLVTSPPASGKTFIAKQLASMLQNCVYLDKDSVIVFIPPDFSGRWRAV